jgi:Cu-Zn family superoxide dismutase
LTRARAVATITGSREHKGAELMTRTQARRLLAVAAVAALAAGPAAADSVTGNIIGANGDRIGTVLVTSAPQGVLLRVQIAPGSLPPGAHGMHLHSVGDCSDVGTFKMSKGHINVANREHGLLNPKGPDNADLPNLIVHRDGSADVELFTTRVRLAHDDAALLDDDGSALVIHENPDDHQTQPIGGAGARIACAALVR